MSSAHEYGYVNVLTPERVRNPQAVAFAVEHRITQAAYAALTKVLELVERKGWQRMGRVPYTLELVKGGERVHVAWRGVIIIVITNDAEGHIFLESCKGGVILTLWTMDTEVEMDDTIGLLTGVHYALGLTSV